MALTRSTLAYKYQILKNFIQVKKWHNAKLTGDKDMSNKNIFKIVGFGLIGGVVGLACAPVLAATAGALGLLGATATTGVAISSLSGIALTNASLAAIGGGALSVGGAGISGGTAIITVASALTTTSITANQ